MRSPSASSRARPVTCKRTAPASGSSSTWAVRPSPTTSRYWKHRRPETTMNLANWLHQTGLVRPDAPAIRRGEKLHSTYAEFAHRSWAVGEYLGSELGSRKGEHDALVARKSAEVLEVLIRGLWAGRD